MIYVHNNLCIFISYSNIKDSNMLMHADHIANGCLHKKYMKQHNLFISSKWKLTQYFRFNQYTSTTIVGQPSQLRLLNMLMASLQSGKIFFNKCTKLSYGEAPVLECGVLLHCHYSLVYSDLVLVRILSIS